MMPGLAVLAAVAAWGILLGWLVSPWLELASCILALAVLVVLYAAAWWPE